MKRFIILLSSLFIFILTGCSLKSTTSVNEYPKIVHIFETDKDYVLIDYEMYTNMLELHLEDGTYILINSNDCAIITHGECPFCKGNDNQ